MHVLRALENLLLWLGVLERDTVYEDVAAKDNGSQEHISLIINILLFNDFAFTVQLKYKQCINDWLDFCIVLLYNWAFLHVHVLCKEIIVFIV